MKNPTRVQELSKLNKQDGKHFNRQARVFLRLKNFSAVSIV